MYSETYPLAVNAGQSWSNNFETLAYATLRKSNLTFLYIGKQGDSLEYFSTYFRSGLFTEGYAQTLLILDNLQLTKGHLPDTIIIDIPFAKSQLESFCTYLKKKGILAKTTLVYNEKHLDRDKVKILQRLELVDDVTDINSWETDFSKKVTFLKKLKIQQHSSLHLSKAMLNGYDSDAVKKIFSLKRFIDIVISTVGIVMLSPILITIALFVKFGSKGPVIYTSSRAGRGFKIFKFYKFRTMEVDADQKIEALAHLNQYGKNEKGARFMKISNDPRVTKVGRFLRKTSLDELPQLFNVLKGDMSLVGNRPLPIYEASTLTTNEFVERFMAPAGMTGLWQIKKKSKPNMTVEERISLDISYARKSSVFFDMWIIAQTPAALFQNNNV
jgi:lipopolysaccharide/colanic/teichoic acid biosynthesis glycosyltransferase